MRNAGANAARGEIIAHHDDDDFSAPGRLSDQVARLLESGKSVTGYRNMRFTDGVRWWQYSNPAPDYALGTSLCYRRDWWVRHPFPDKQVAEDYEFLCIARQYGQTVAADSRDLMFATCHTGNSSPRQLKGPQWREL